MSDVKQSITYFNFSGGLNTEASPVNMEPNDAVDLLNIELESDGSIRPRKGVDFVGSKSDGTIYETTTFDQTSLYGSYTNLAPSTFIFEHTLSTGERKNLAIAVVETNLYIYEIQDLYTLSDHDQPIQTIDISTTDNAFVHYKTQMIQNENRVYLLNEFLPLGYLEYSEAIGGMLYKIQDIYIRDLDSDGEVCSYVNNDGKLWQCIKGHRSGADNEPGVGDSTDSYWTVMGAQDTTNYSSWVDSAAANSRVTILSEYWDEENFVDAWDVYNCILTHTSAASNKPGSGVDWETYWIKTETVGGSSIGSLPNRPAPAWLVSTGYSLLGAATYTSNIEIVQWSDEVRPIGWKAGTFSIGRFWLAGNPLKPNTLYFSQAIIEAKQYNRMFQEADPYDQQDSDIVDSDGGILNITGANRIEALAPYRGGVIVFANNGIWYVSGSTGIFKATDFSIDKISDEGIAGQATFAIVEDKLAYFTNSNVFIIDFPDISQIPKPLKISGKIDTFYRSIPINNKKTSKVLYSPAHKILYLFTNFEDKEYLDNQNSKHQPNQFRDVLIFDGNLNAWYKYSLSTDDVGNDVYIADAFITDGGDNEQTVVIDLLENNVVSNASELVFARSSTGVPEGSIVGLMLAKKSTNFTQWAYGRLDGTTTQDFSLSSVDIVAVPSYIESAYQIFDDIEHQKQVPKITTIFERLEFGIIDDTTGEDVNQAGCLYQVNFDWATSSKSPKYGTARQAYRPYRFGISYNDGSDPGLLTVVNMHSVRGRGRGLQLRFSNDGTKDFHLYGWQLQLRASKRT